MLCLSAHARREVPLPRLICSKTQPKSGLKCVISPTNHIIGNWTNQIARNEPTRRGWLILRPRSNYVHSERIIIGILDFLTDHDHVHLWEMRQRISREEQPDQASKDSCIFFTDLILWDMRQRVQPTRPQKEAWGYPWTTPALHLPDLHHSFQRKDNFHQHVQTNQRGMDQTPQTWSKKVIKRKLSPPAGPSPKYPKTQSTAKTYQEKNRVAAYTKVLPDDPETRALYIQHWQSIRTEEHTGNRVQDRRGSSRTSGWRPWTNSKSPSYQPTKLFSAPWRMRSSRPKTTNSTWTCGKRTTRRPWTISLCGIVTKTSPGLWKSIFASRMIWNPSLLRCPRSLKTSTYPKKTLMTTWKPMQKKRGSWTRNEHVWLDIISRECHIIYPVW